MIRKIRYIVIFVLLSYSVFLKSQTVSLGFWKFTSAKGEFNINGLYRSQERVLSGLTDYPKTYRIGGGIFLKTKSYIWHPNFVTLNIDLDYNPEKRQDRYLIIPDQTEVRDLKKISANLNFFSKKIISLNTFFSINENFINNENLSNIKSNSKKIGGSLFFKNKFVPFSVSANRLKWDQKEYNSGRTFKNEQSNFESRFSKTSSKGNSHEVSFSYSNYFRQEANSYQVQNNVSNFNVNNNIFFDNNKKYKLNSRIINFSQQGFNNFKRFQIMESFLLKLPEKFTLTSNYYYYNTKQAAQGYKQHSFKNKLGHQLFLSLKSNIFYEYNVINHTDYRETNNISGINFTYTKKIPTGNLNLAYNYYSQQQIMNGEPKLVTIANEEHDLFDNQVILLNKPYIKEETVVVTDLTGTIIYQLNLDYVLVSRNNYIEIQRLPGGQISNGLTVYVDYVVSYPGSYQYQSHNNSFSASVVLFNHFIELYFRNIQQYYNNLAKTDFLVLNYFSQNIYGVRFIIRFINTGFEIDNYNSSIIPYQMKRAFIQLQGVYNKKLIYSLNGNLRNYYIIDEDVLQQYIDISGKVAYKVGNQTKINIKVGYRNQSGPGIDLNLFTNRNEITTVYRQLYFTFGFEIYRRYYLSEKINYVGVDFKIARKF